MTLTSARTLKFKGTVRSRVDASPLLESPGDAVLIERGYPRLLLLSCPCGCGDEFPINLDPRAGPAWVFYKSRRAGISLYPSVWRESGCRSHYVIWRNKIFLFSPHDEEFDSEPQSDEAILLAEAVRKQLPIDALISFTKIAENLNEIPWDVLMVCRQLVREGLAHEGTGKERGTFGRQQVDTF